MAVVINGTTGITSVNGSASAPSVTGTDTDTGIVYGTNTLSLSTGGTTAVTVDSSQNVGIGTTPSYKFDVLGATSRFYFDSTNNTVTLDGNGTNRDLVFYARYANTATLQTDGYWIFKTGNTERMRIDTSGNVGIGTSSPSKKLEVGALGAFRLQTGSTTMDCTPTAGATDGFVWNTSAASYYDWAYAGTVKMRLDSSGNLLVGTTTAVERLTIGNSSATSSGINLRTTQTDFSIIPSNSAAGGVTISTSWVSGGNGPLIFTQAAGERMRLMSGGQFGVGLSDVIAGSASYINTICNGGTQYGITIKNVSATASNALNFYNSSTAQIGRVELGASTTTYATSSDYRLKENIQPMQGALATVAQLKPCTYTWKADGSAGQGFIAHELKEIVPDAVCGEKDAVDSEGNPQYQGIDTSFLVATLTAAIQEQQAIIEQLRADVEQLKGQA